MATDPQFEPMDQDVEDTGDTLQVQVANDLFKNNNENETNENEVELDFEADDLEITEFLKTDERLDAANKAKLLATGAAMAAAAKTVDLLDGARAPVDSPMENMTISVIGPDDEEDDSDKEDGEISETQSQSSEASNNGEILDSSQFFSPAATRRGIRPRNDIRRERSPVARKYPNPYLEFDDAKIQSRALRFGLANSTTTTGATPAVEKNEPLSDDDLLNLYIGCGLVQDDGGKITLDKVNPNHRLDSILIRGTNHMNTNEIFKYLYDLGHKPMTMEWVNDAMCVVIYANQHDAAASLIKTSKPIIMDPRIVERKRSIVQSTENEKEETSEEKVESMNEDFDYDKVDAIPQSWITVPMPPGYVWRFGAPCEKARGILVRFATKQDKKQERAERFSEFYQKYGNPNKLGGNRENSGENVRRRKKIRSELPGFEPDRKEKEEATIRESQIKTANPNDKNGWGQLSAMWDDEEAFQRSARDRLTTARHGSKDSDSAPSPMKRSSIVSNKEVTPPSKTMDAREILKTRQKRKRGTNSSDEEGESDHSEDLNEGENERFGLNDWKDGSHRRRQRSSRVNDEDDDDDDGDTMAWRERLSAPRMRMHADEEEERMKRRAFRRLGHKRHSSSSNDAGFQTNPWSFSSRDTSSFRNKVVVTQARRPISERLGAKRSSIPQQSEVTDHDNRRDSEADVSMTGGNPGGFDLRQKLISMRRTGNDDEEGSTDEEEDLHNLIFYPND